MSNIIQGVKVDGTIYKYDYESLENLPDPELPSATASDEGKALVVNSTGDPAWKTPQRVMKEKRLWSIPPVIRRGEHFPRPFPHPQRVMKGKHLWLIIQAIQHGTQSFRRILRLMKEKLLYLS